MDTIDIYEMPFTQGYTYRQNGFLVSFLMNAKYLGIDKPEDYDVKTLEETIDEIVSLLRDGHIERLKKGLCSIHSGIVFLELLTNLERIADHCSNIGCDIISRSYESDYEAHEYLHNMHNAPNQSYSENYDRFMRKYFDPAKAFGI